MESYYTGPDARHVWQGLQSKQYKGRPSHNQPNDASLPDSIYFMHTSTVQHRNVREGTYRPRGLVLLARQQGWTVFQGAFSEHVQVNWKAHSRLFSPSPCPGL